MQAEGMERDREEQPYKKIIQGRAGRGMRGWPQLLSYGQQHHKYPKIADLLEEQRWRVGEGPLSQQGHAAISNPLVFI